MALLVSCKSIFRRTAASVFCLLCVNVCVNFSKYLVHLATLLARGSLPATEVRECHSGKLLNFKLQNLTWGGVELGGG